MRDCKVNLLSAEYLALARRRITRPHARVPRPERADEELPLFAGLEWEPEVIAS